MAKFKNPLDHLRVAAPCPAHWEQMAGDEQVRFCGQCNLNVYNLSGLSKREAEALLSKTEGRLCVRYYRRADGTILTRNCPVGLDALKRQVSRVGSATLSAVLSFCAGVGLYRTASGESPIERLAPGPVMGTLVGSAVPNKRPINGPGPPSKEMMGQAVMGQIVVPRANRVPHNRSMQRAAAQRASR